MSNPKKPNKDTDYLFIPSYNKREADVMKSYYENGWRVLKNGWPDLFCYHPMTQDIEFIEVKSQNQYKETKRGKKLGLTKDQLRMHQYLRKAGFTVKIVHIE